MAVASGACVLNFCASWCEPCVNLNAVFSELAEEHTGLRFVQACQEPTAAHLPARVSLAPPAQLRSRPAWPNAARCRSVPGPMRPLRDRVCPGVPLLARWPADGQPHGSDCTRPGGQGAGERNHCQHSQRGTQLRRQHRSGAHTRSCASGHAAGRSGPSLSRDALHEGEPRRAALRLLATDH